MCDQEIKRTFFKNESGHLGQGELVCQTGYSTFQLEIKSSREGVIKGYASVFDAVDSNNDRVVRGAFKKTLEEAAETGLYPKMLWQHSETDLIGSWKILKEDDTGLYVEGQLTKDVAKATEAQALIKAGAIDGLSIGYRVKKALRGKDDRSVRLLTEVVLLEISLVTFPANQAARLITRPEIN